MEVKSGRLRYKDCDGKEFEGVLCFPKNQPPESLLPGILVYHAFGGCSDFEANRAAELAKEGFIVLAADVYGKDVFGTSKAENMALVEPLMADRQGILKNRLVAALTALKKMENVDANKIGAIGYCFGGMCVLDLARHKLGLQAVVSFHGKLAPLPGLPLEHLDTSVQVHHGDTDTVVGREEVQLFLQEMRYRDVDWSFCTYGKAGHCFTVPDIQLLKETDLTYNKEADSRSWASAVAFLKEKLFEKS